MAIKELYEYLLVALLCGGYVLIEDVLPADITGYNAYQVGKNAMVFVPGAVMGQIILADEINRGSPKTQSSLLEVMQENQVTVDGVTRELPRPFIVLATQNPIEFTGTFPLPEAQLDRFLLKFG